MDKSNELKQRLGPGVWVDGNDHLHFSIPELIQAFDLPDNPVTRARVTAMVTELYKQVNPQAQIIERDHKDQNN